MTFPSCYHSSDVEAGLLQMYMLMHSLWNPTHGQAKRCEEHGGGYLCAERGFLRSETLAVESGTLVTSAAVERNYWRGAVWQQEINKALHVH